MINFIENEYCQKNLIKENFLNQENCQNINFNMPTMPLYENKLNEDFEYMNNMNYFQNQKQNNNNNNFAGSYNIKTQDYGYLNNMSNNNNNKYMNPDLMQRKFNMENNAPMNNLPNYQYSNYQQNPMMMTQSKIIYNLFFLENVNYNDDNLKNDDPTKEKSENDILIRRKKEKFFEMKSKNFLKELNKNFYGII